MLRTKRTAAVETSKPVVGGTTKPTEIITMNRRTGQPGNGKRELLHQLPGAATAVIAESNRYQCHSQQ